jgi:hypothetical protein
MTDDYDFCRPIRDNEEMYGELEEEAADARLEARRRNAFWDAFDRGELFEPSTLDEEDE